MRNLFRRSVVASLASFCASHESQLPVRASSTACTRAELVLTLCLPIPRLLRSKHPIQLFPINLCGVSDPALLVPSCRASVWADTGWLLLPFYWRSHCDSPWIPGSETRIHTSSLS